MKLRRSSWLAVVLLAFCLAATPSHASLGRAIPEILEVLARAGHEVGKFVDSIISKIKASWDSLFAPDWSEEEVASLVQVLRNRGLQNVDESSIDELVVEDVWRQDIYPEVEGKWKLEPRASNEQYWKDMEHRCIREGLRNSKPEDLAENILGAGLHYTGLSTVGQILFVARFLDPELAKKDALCLLASKVTDDMIDAAARSWSEYAKRKDGAHTRLATCLKEVRDSAPPIGECSG